MFAQQMLLLVSLFSCHVCSVEESCEEESKLAVLRSSYTEDSKCSQKHIKDSLRSNIGCKPVTVVLELPWPNNTAIQQVSSYKYCSTIIFIYLCFR